MERYFEKIGNHLIVNKQRYRNNDLIVFVFYDFIPVVKFNHEKLAERKLAAVELVELGICNQSTAGHICGFHRNSVARFLTLKNTLGIEALLDENRGLKKPLKYIDTVRETIERLLSEYPECSDQQIAKRASEELNMDIHRNGVARIRVSNQPDDESEVIFFKERLVELHRIAQEIDQGKNDAHQLELNFEADELFRQKKEELEQLQPLQSANKTEQNLIERLQKGERNPFAGSLMHHLFLEEIDYKQLFKCLPPSDGGTYQNIDILSTLFFSIANGLKSIEALKLVNPKDLGCLLGAERAPDKDVIRKKLHKLAEANLSGELIDGFARMLLDKQRIDDEVFFIDGHFLPYYGLHVIAKGYYTVRRLALKGNELYVVSDLNGRPLFSFTESNEIDFRPVISQAADKLIELGIRRPVLTFDRGGYGIRFFSELDRKADFVTWAKYLNDKQLEQISDDCFASSLCLNEKTYRVAEEYRDVSESVQTARKEGRTSPLKMQLRLVIIENTASGKRMGIYTNNRLKPAHTIACYMLNRWGDSENLYKELMAQFNLDYHPGYDIDELQEQPLVDNPDIGLTKKAIRLLEAEIDGLLENQRQIQTRLSQRKDKRLMNKLANIIKELEEKKLQKAHFEEQLASLPDKVSIVELLDGKPMSRCDLEKKKLYDLMQFMVLHSYERLQELFKPYYSDSRDIKPVLRMICRQSGVLILIGDTLIVLLDRIDRKKHRLAAEQLCHQLNRANITLNGRVKLKLYFYLSKF
jgi:hypothetical protein